MPPQFLSVLLASAVPGAAAYVPDPPGSVAVAGGEAEVRRAERSWAASVARHEEAFLRRFTAPSFVAVFDGAVISRAALIAGAAKRRPGTATDRLTSLRVRRFGAAAVAQGEEWWLEGGRRRRIVWSDLWVHCGAWRLLTSTSVGWADPLHVQRRIPARE